MSHTSVGTSMNMNEFDHVPNLPVGTMSVQKRLEDLHVKLNEQRENYLGYPNNQDLNNMGLSRFLNFAINNVGDPYLGNNGMNTCQFETEVIDFFADILHAPEKDYWGYLTNGGTEGNLYGLYLARESYRDGIVYHSADSHYSVPKAARILGLKNVVVPSLENGEMDYSKLKPLMLSLRQFPAIINANIGTTMKGAIDQVEIIVQCLREVGIDKYYIHCDAALFGAMLPFVEGASVFDFRLPIGSIAISGHKLLGSPVPCGIAIARKEHLSKIGGGVEYIGSIDKTISGSRDGFSALLLWQQLMRYGKSGLKRAVEDCLKMTDYTLGKLRTIDWPCWVNRFSNIVVLKKPSAQLVAKWQLATEGDHSHIVLMPSVKKETIDRFIIDLIEFMEKKGNRL